MFSAIAEGCHPSEPDGMPRRSVRPVSDTPLLRCIHPTRPTSSIASPTPIFRSARSSVNPLRLRPLRARVAPSPDDTGAARLTAPSALASIPTPTHPGHAIRDARWKEHALARLGVITDEISEDFDHALAVSAELGIREIELRSVWGTSIVDHDEEAL